MRRGRIATITDGRVEFELGEEVPAATAANVTLLLAIFKFDRMEWAIEKCTELGVSRIVPVIARRTDAHLASAAAKRVERWRRIALQAAEQSAAPPRPRSPLRSKLQEAANLPGALRIVLAESEQQTLLRDVLASRETPKAKFSSRSAPKAVGPKTNCSSFRMPDGSPLPSARRFCAPKPPPSPPPRSQSPR